MYKILTILVLIGFLGSTSYASANRKRSQVKGAILGSGAGAIIGHQFGKRGAGALIGGVTGFFYGHNHGNAVLAHSRVGQRPVGLRRGAVGVAPYNNFRNPYRNFRNRYIQPAPRYPNGYWVWSGHWVWYGYWAWVGHWVWNAPTAYWYYR